jgi:uncharacterized protein (DUF3084 family)
MESLSSVSKEVTDESQEANQESKKKTVLSSCSADLRTRISNAVEAIRGLGGEVQNLDRSQATDEDLQADLEDLTNQYKRLKNLKGKDK